MLLSEIVATRYARENDPRGQYEWIPDIPASNKQSPMGAKIIPVHFTNEEQQFLKRYNIQTPIKTIPVVFAYTIKKDTKTEEGRTLLDALKRRLPNKEGDPTSFISDENLQLMMQAVVQKLKGGIKANNAQMKGKWADTVKNVNLMSNILRNNAMAKEPFVVVPIASSSQVVMDMSKILASDIRARLIDGAFLKSVPHLSKLIIDKKQNQLVPRGTESPHRKIIRYKQEVAELEKQIDFLNKGEYSTPAKQQAAENKMAKLQATVDRKKESIKRGFSAKNIPYLSSPDGNLGYYRSQTAVPEKAQQLNGANIIFVDDNVDSGFTVQDALKALYRLGIAPKQVLGLCPHSFD